MAASGSFTQADAERTLPLVRRIVRDAMQEHAAWRRAVGLYELEAAGLTSAEAVPPVVASLQADVEASAARLDGYIRELDQVGCVIRDFGVGLVEFPSTRDGRTVFLCWRYGEAGIGHWRDTDAPIDALQPLEASHVTPVT